MRTKNWLVAALLLAITIPALGEDAKSLDKVAVRLDGKTGSGGFPLYGSAVSGRVALGTGVNTLGSDSGLTFTGTGATFGLLLGGTDLGLARASAGTLKVTSGGSNLGSLQAGNLTATALATPTMASVVPDGTPGATTYGYKVVSLLGDGTSTAASAEMTTATGNATLDGTNRVYVSWVNPTNSAGTKVYRTTGGAAPPKLISTQAAGVSAIFDIGNAGTPETPATANTTGRVLADDIGAGTASPATRLHAYKTSGARVRVETAADGYPGFEIFEAGTAKWTLFNTTTDVLSLAFTNQAAATFTFTGSGTLGLGAGASDPDVLLSRAAAATLQLGAANAAAPVNQTLRAQGGSGTDKPGAKFTLQGGQSTGTGAGGAISFQTSTSATTGSGANAYSTRYYISAQPKTLTLGSNTNFVRVDFPASSTVSVVIGYNVQVSDSAAPPEFKAHGGRYYVSAYRKSTGNAVAGTVVETGESGVQSVGNALTDTFTITGDANGILIGTNVTVGTGLTAPNVGLLTFDIHVHTPAAGVLVTPQ